MWRSFDGPHHEEDEQAKKAGQEQETEAATRLFLFFFLFAEGERSGLSSPLLGGWRCLFATFSNPPGSLTRRPFFCSISRWLCSARSVVCYRFCFRSSASVRSRCLYDDWRFPPHRVSPRAHFPPRLSCFVPLAARADTLQAAHGRSRARSVTLQLIGSLGPTFCRTLGSAAMCAYRADCVARVIRL